MSKDTALKRFYRADELVEVLGISRSLVFNLIHEGVIPSVKLGEKCLLIPVSFVEGLEKSANAKCKESKQCLDQIPNELVSEDKLTEG